MSVSALSAYSSTFQAGGNNPMAQMKQIFDDLVSALKSGNLDDAKKAFNKLQKNAPPQGADNKNPMSAEVQNLQKALDSGDLNGAQTAVSQMQAKMPKGPPGGGPPKGPPPGGGGGRPPQDQKKDTVQLDSANSAATSSTSSSKVYDKMDANKDGTVSAMEILFYGLKNSSDSSSVSVLTIGKNKEKSNIQAYA